MFRLSYLKFEEYHLLIIISLFVNLKIFQFFIEED